MNLRLLIEGHTLRMAEQLVDSALSSTRAYWRMTYFGATEAEARDLRPFAEVLAERAVAK